MDRLFEQFERTNTAFSDYRTSMFEFFNRTAREEFSSIRNILEAWYVDFPKKDQAEFLGRFRSNNKLHLLGALLELFTFRLFNSIEFEIDRTVESCDFTAFKNGSQIFLECTLSGDPLSNDMVEQHVNLICDRLDNLKSQFFLNLSVEKFNKESPAYGKLTRWLESKIAEVDYREVEQKLAISSSVTNWVFNSNGWVIKISLIPKGNASEESRNMGIIDSGNWGFIDSGKFIYDAIHDKRPSKYGKMNKPYIIIVNSLDPTLDDYSITQALYRHSASEFGFYGNSKHQKNSSVSGILIIKGLYMTSIANPKLQYWPNPWAKNPLELPFDQKVLSKAEPSFAFTTIKGLTPNEIFTKMI